MERTAIITGGAGGMGLATARILGRDHRIVIADVDPVHIDRAVIDLVAEGIDVTGVACDITDRAAVERLFAEAEEHGHVRAVVHSAGVSPQMGDAAFIIKVNAVGTVNVAETFLEIAGEGDVLVNVASIAGHLTPRALQPTRAFRHAFTDLGALERRLVAGAERLPRKARPGAAYSTSKAFVIWYSEEMAAAFGERGARILSVSPGSFDTAMGRLEERSGSGKLIEYAALKRFGEPDEVAEVLAFTASEGPGYLTGTDILVDGGTKAGLGLKGLIAMARGS